MSVAITRVSLPFFWAFGQVKLECQLATARAALGDGEYERVWGEGRAMTIEESVALAIPEGLIEYRT